MGRPSSYFFDQLDPEVAHCLDAAIDRLSRAGVHNAEVRPPKGDADPLADITVLEKVDFVMKGGEVVRNEYTK